jgi:hypothetical protein
MASACGAAPPAAPAKVVPHHALSLPVARVPGSFWEEVQWGAVALPPAVFERDKLVHPAQKERFAALPEASRTRLLERGVLAVPRSDHETSLGEAYVALARKHVPFVITLDALFAIAFRSIDRALDEFDRDVVAGALPRALSATDERLAAESHAARSDTAEAYALARGVIAVARVLLDPTKGALASNQEVVNAEVAQVQTHSAPAKSPLLGRVLDYGAFDTQAGLAFGDVRIAQFRAVTWLARAALALSAEPPAVDVARARTQTRAAMLLSRATNEAWGRIADTFAFAAGVGDDPGARELLAKTSALGLDLRDEATIGNVVRVDHIRAALTRDAVATVEDTNGVKPTFRLLSPSAPADAHALLDLFHGDLPTALAVGVALGSPEARTLLDAEIHDPHALDEAAHTLPTDRLARHASLHASGLDALAVYLGPSSLDAQRSWRDTPAYRRRKLEVALSAWATLRHAVIPFAHGTAQAVLDEPPTAFDDVPAAIEPHPEALASLVALIRQARHGLSAHTAMREAGAAAQLLERVEAILVDALHIALAQAVAPLDASLAHVLGAMPSRIASIERSLGPSAAPLVVVTAANPPKERVLEDATGYPSDVWVAIDVAGAAALFVGVRIPFYEGAATLRETDTSWAKRLVESSPPSPAWIEPFTEP